MTKRQPDREKRFLSEAPPSGEISHDS